MPSIPSVSTLNPSRSTTPAVDSNDAARSRLTQLVANQTGQDPRAADLAQKVNNLVHSKFGGDYKKAFQHYAGANGEVSRDGINRLLSDAGVGNGFTRGFYTDGVMDKFDTNRNGSVSWSEFSGGMRANGVSI
jgi:hypothetical protein